MKTIFTSIKAKDEHEINVARYEPDGDICAVIQMVHGFGEAMQHFEELARYFAANGVAFVIHDQRGHGKMEGLTPKQKKAARGAVDSYEHFLDDVEVVRAKIGEWYAGLPVTLYGFSMGGNIMLNYLLKRSQDSYAKAIIQAPWLRMYKPLPKPVLGIAGVLAKLNKKAAINASIKIEYIARNPQILEILKSDGIYHNRMRINLFFEISAAGEYALENAKGITLPSLLLIPASDMIVCPKAMREFGANVLDNVKVKEYPDGYHCLHYDLVADEVRGDIISFLKEA